MARALTEVIDQLIQADASLGDSLASLRQTVMYSAPETMTARWWDVAAVLERHAPPGSANHEKLVAIFTGKDAAST